MSLMPMPPPPRRLWVWACLGGLVVAGAAAARLGTASVAAPLPDYGSVPAFALVDQRGRQVTGATFAGRVWVADFIFTRCAGQCPMMSSRMQELAARLPAGFQRVSISVDPAWDTPAVLSAYAERYGARDGSWLFLTGEPGAVRRLCRDGFHLAVGDEGTAEEPITHSTRLALMDRQGRLRGYYDAMEEADMARLPRDVRALR